MNKLWIGVIVGTLLLIFGGAYLMSKDNTTAKQFPLPSSPEYFWGDGCPHCTIVEEFLNSWDKKDSINIDKKEVWSNKTNAEIYNSRADYCKIPSTQRGVPMMFTPEGKCLQGDEEIIEFLKKL